jgi:alpha-galactosidase/6-phospho-beta-glucosidase family protein
MATVVGVYKRTGNRVKCVGVCNGRCHEAMQPTQLKEPRRNACMCICGGANHGLGLAHAKWRRAGLRPADLARFAQEHGHNPEDLVVIDRMRTSEWTARKLARQVLQPAMTGVPSDNRFVCLEVVT